MTGKMIFSENVNLSGYCTGDYVTCQASIEDLSIKASNSRKISVKAIVTLKLICESLQDIQTVSYTHLDVYKRQGEYDNVISSNTNI